ncbi:MAG: N-acetyl-gamma-glutamyl-phosphate reductase [Candidatus Dadabacteria bacterium]|nr:MAG: N-acetyl-gamma-glutamyl-phosphate reductase [Candidatus Dadabacteria bacterium]
MTDVGIIGASGYTGAELVRLLCRHPEVRITAITSRKYAGRPLGDCFPSLGHLDLTFVSHEEPGLFDRAEVFFTALPHKASMPVVKALLEAGRKVIDLSADFRFADPTLYEAHYGPHACPDLLAEAVYGLTEVHGAAVERARLVGNPGCYPTSVLLPLVPLLLEGVIRPEGIVADSKSGVSGAGREPSQGSLFCEVNEGFKAYKVASHRHEPEIRKELELAAGCEVPVVFTPHLVPMDRGILSTIYALPADGADAARVREVWRAFYRGAPFVRVLDEGRWPSTADVRGTNACAMAVADHGAGRLVIVSVIDNLVKGASGQAVQNLNRMMGWDETLGLPQEALFP